MLRARDPAATTAPVQRARLQGLLACASAIWLLPGRARATDDETRRWLERMHEAIGRQSFQGTFVVSAGGPVASARILHYCDGGHQYERIDSLDGQRRQVFRHNDTVLTLWPASRVALLESRPALGEFPTLLRSSAERIGAVYDARPAGAGRVAGLDARVLELHPRDAYRFGLRLWAEPGTGMLLRAEVLGDRGEVIEASAFSELRIGVRPQPELVLQPMRRLEGYRLERPQLEPTEPGREGWAFGRLPAGFALSRCVRRAINPDRSPGADSSSADKPATVLQTIFTDGLTHVSVFAEPLQPQRHKQELLMSVGATQTLARRQGDWWITVIGDVPVISLRAFAGALERRS